MSNSSSPETPGEPSPGVVHRVLHSVRSHPVLTGVLVLGVLVAMGLSVYIDMGLYFTIPILVMIGVIAFVLFRLWRSRRPADDTAPTSTAGRVGFAAVALAGVLTFLIIQLVPYGRAHSNPAGTGEPDWATPRTRELMVERVLRLPLQRGGVPGVRVGRTDLVDGAAPRRRGP